MKEFISEAEISYEDGVPLAPNIAAVIVLCGSDYDMGCQCSQQINQIFAHDRFYLPLGFNDWQLSDLACQDFPVSATVFYHVTIFLSNSYPEFVKPI